MESDRRRAETRQRPFASGVLSISWGLLLALALLGAGALIAAWLPLGIGLLLAGSLAATLAYSFSLKRRPIVDVVILASLYTARIYAGGIAAEAPVSEWLASFSMFLFFSLAFLRRASDLVASGGTSSGRGYRPGDLGPVSAMGITSGYLSVLVLALYVSRGDVRRFYAHPGWLWGLCPLALFWISHLWLLARRGEVNDDPLSFALRSPASWAVLLLGLALAWLGS
jgi:4-hydroxybenzoate polyprenyltransferase